MCSRPPSNHGVPFTRCLALTTHSGDPSQEGLGLGPHHLSAVHVGFCLTAVDETLNLLVEGGKGRCAEDLENGEREVSRDLVTGLRRGIDEDLVSRLDHRDGALNVFTREVCDPESGEALFEINQGLLGPVTDTSEDENEQERPSLLDRRVLLIVNQTDSEEMLVDVVLKTLKGQDQVLVNPRISDALVVPLVAIGHMIRVKSTEGFKDVIGRPFDGRSVLQVDWDNTVECIIHIMGSEVSLECLDL